MGGSVPLLGRTSEGLTDRRGVYIMALDQAILLPTLPFHTWLIPFRFQGPYIGISATFFSSCKPLLKQLFQLANLFRQAHDLLERSQTGQLQVL